MKVTVRAGSWAKNYLGGEAREVESGGSMTALDAALLAGIPQDEAGLIAVGGNAVKPDYALCDGDDVLVYPVIIGG